MMHTAYCLGEDSSQLAKIQILGAARSYMVRSVRLLVSKLVSLHEMSNEIFRCAKKVIFSLWSKKNHKMSDLE